jgi:thioredoxin 1
MIELTKDEQLEEIVGQKKFVLVDFFATWCGPCQMLAPELEKLDHSKDEDVEIVEIDIDKFEKLAESNQIQVVPTLVFFNQGKEVAKISGYKTEKQLLETIKRLKK